MSNGTVTTPYSKHVPAISKGSTSIDSSDLGFSRTVEYVISSTSSRFQCIIHVNTPHLRYTSVVVDDGVMLYLQNKNTRVSSFFSNPT